MTTFLSCIERNIEKGKLYVFEKYVRCFQGDSKMPSVGKLIHYKGGWLGGIGALSHRNQIGIDSKIILQKPVL